MSSADLIDVEGTVVKHEANGLYVVQLDNGHSVQAYMTGKMDRAKIGVVVADRVRVQLTPYNPKMGRIVWREK